MQTEEQEIEGIASEVADEVKRAVSLFGKIGNPHEAYGVIMEELDEFWDEVKEFNLAKGRDTRPKMRTELIQLAAMAVRTIMDCDL